MYLMTIFHGICHANIHRKYIHISSIRHQTDTGITGCKISRHDSRYILSGLGHALFHNSVIRAHDNHRFFLHTYLRRTCDAGDLTGSLNSGDPHQGIL